MKLKLRELRLAVKHLRNSSQFACAVSSMYFDAGDGIAAARLNELAARLVAERETIERLIAKAPGGVDKD
jgi:hypothetical protein